MGAAQYLYRPDPPFGDLGILYLPVEGKLRPGALLPLLCGQGGWNLRPEVSMEGHAAHLQTHIGHGRDPEGHRVLELLYLAQADHG